MPQKILWGIIIFIFIAIISCQAPRNNPLDPNNSGYALASIEGTVQTFSVPYTGISDVKVFWPGQNVLVTTDKKGKFVIDNIKRQNGILIFSKESYKTDTINIVWNDGDIINPQVNLNKIPKLDSIAIYTNVINQFSPQPLANLIVKANISDNDNDIDSVYVVNAELKLKKSLVYNITEKNYQISLTTADLNVNDIEETIGLDFKIIVQDIFKEKFEIGSGKVSRVIKNTVDIKSPANDTTINSNITLQWYHFNSGYKFTYMIEIYTYDFINSQLILRSEKISSDKTNFQVDLPYNQTRYYWVIWVIDQFQNRSRSKPATFNVQ